VPRSQIKSATLVKEPLREYVKVDGPLLACADEASVVVLSIYVVVAQNEAWAHGREVPGTMRVDADVGWTVEATLGGSMIFERGKPALATGIMISVDRGKGGDVPVPQTFSWTETVDIA
jgi:hypothetical protein